MTYYTYKDINVTNFIQSGTTATLTDYTSFPTGEPAGNYAFNKMNYFNSNLKLGYQYKGSDITANFGAKHSNKSGFLGGSINVADYNAISFVLVGGGGGGGYGGNGNNNESGRGAGGGGAGGLIYGSISVANETWVTWDCGTGGNGGYRTGNAAANINSATDGNNTSITIGSNTTFTAPGGKQGVFGINSNNSPAPAGGLGGIPISSTYYYSTTGGDGQPADNGDLTGGAGGGIDNNKINTGYQILSYYTEDITHVVGNAGYKNGNGNNATGYGAGGGGGGGASEGAGDWTKGGNGAGGYLKIYFYA